MRQITFMLAILTAAVLSACGGSDSSSTPAAKPKFAAQVSFGDSLSDVGTYAVGGVAALGGGKYTINGDNTAINAALTGKNWTELTATSFGLPAPCAAQTGLDGAATSGFAVPVSNFVNCLNYAQGGARVSNPVGPDNKLTGSILGQLTLPVATQIANHLARNGGKFNGNEIVTVMAGGNDALMLLGQLSAAAAAAGAAEGAKVGAATFASTLVPLLAAGATDPATAAAAIAAAMGAEAQRPGSTSTTLTGVAVAAAATQPGNAATGSPDVYGPMVAKAQAAAATAGAAAGATAGNAYATANGPGLVPQMANAGLELAALIKTQIIGKGANYVVVNNLPDLSVTPSGKAQPASSQTLIAGMVQGFNTGLRAGLDGLDAKFVYVDLATITQDQVKNGAKYGFTNTSTPACGPNALGSTSLVCTAKNVIAGDVSHYMFADNVHPTPYAYTQIAKSVTDEMTRKGWL